MKTIESIDGRREDYGVRFVSEDDGRNFFERAMFPFRDKQKTGSESYPQRQLAAHVGKSREWVSDQLNGEGGFFSLDAFPPLLDIVEYSEPIYIGGNLDRHREDEFVNHLGQERVKIQEDVQEHVLNLFTIEELADMTGYNRNTIRDYRLRGKKNSVPLDFWKQFTDEAERYLRELEEFEIQVDIVDYSRYRHAHENIEQATVARELGLEELEELIEQLESDNGTPDDTVETGPRWDNSEMPFGGKFDHYFQDDDSEP